MPQSKNPPAKVTRPKKENWVLSDEGRLALGQALEKAAALKAKLQAGRRIATPLLRGHTPQP